MTFAAQSEETAAAIFRCATTSAETQEAREPRVEAEDEPVDIDRAPAEIHGLAKELCAGERAVHDVQIHGEREDQDKHRREREVGHERPARRGFAKDLLDRSQP